MVRLVQIVHLSWVKIDTISKQTEMSFHLSLVTFGVPLGASKMISDPTVCMTQTMHLSCTDANSISKWTKKRFHMTQMDNRCVQNDF
jgi:hypothetical protein